MYRPIGAAELIARGVRDFAALRPVQNADEDPLVSNATLRQDEWQMIDTRVNDVMRERLTVADDLRGKGLVQPVGLGTLLRVTERLEDFSAADLSYDGDTAPTGDRPSFLKDTIPVPVISKDFRINWRQLEASRTTGVPLDTTAAAQATRKVRDKLQWLIVNGWGQGPTGTVIPGLTTATNRMIVTLGTAWDLSGGEIINDVERWLATAYTNNFFGPFFLYAPKNYWATLQEDYSAVKGDLTYLQRILAFSEIEQVRPLDALADDNVLLVQMTEDVIDLSEAQAVTTIQWQKNPLVTLFRVLMVGGPHIKSVETEDGNTLHGIVHLS